jgi:lipoprotein-anchoring transpeptidase ErfK/SrfK
MKARSVASRILLVLVATMMLALSATLAWAAVSDYQVRGLVPKGVTIVGVDLSGMTEAQARDAIEANLSTPMLRPLTVTGDHKTWTLDPKGTVSIDVDTMLNEAYSTRREATFVTRLNSQLRGAPLPNDIKPAFSVDTSAIAAWVDQTAAQIDRKPKDATRTLAKGYKFKITPEVYGATLNRASSVQQIATALNADAALAATTRSVALPVASKKPKVLQSKFKTAIIVSLNQCKIYLYNGAKLVKTYDCAPGQAAYPTPTGDFKIEEKLANSTWFNPHAAWSANMPDTIGPGPSNPMGVRKIGINYSGVFFHGIPPGEYSSIGTHASHGCMRMMPSAVLDLFGRVSVGNPVYIRD